MKSSVKKDLDTLSKNLYLESPDLWIEFLDKVNSGIFDELVLFFATKYNYISIVKYAIDNNLIDINSKSRNKEFATIYDHLVYVARQNNYKDLSDYFSNLKKPNKEISKNNKNDKTNIKTKNKDGEWKYRTSLYRGSINECFDKDSVYKIVLIGTANFDNGYLNIKLENRNAVLYKKAE